MRSNKETDILVTDYIPQSDLLAEKLRESGLFKQVRSMGKIQEYHEKNKFDYIFNYHRKNAETVENQLNFSFKEYDEIYIFHDDTWFSRYFKCANIPYNLIEDGLDNYKIISKTPFEYMVHKKDIKSFIKNLFRIGFVYCGYDKNTKSVEVNSIDGVEINHLAGKKLIEVPRKPMFDSLSVTELQTLKLIFMKDIPKFDDRKSVLLITQPLFVDGIVSSESEQIQFYRSLLQQYANGYDLIIKPHPRDNVDYSTVFPQAVVLNKNMPLEIIALIEKPHFAKILSAGSTCTNIVAADEYITETI